MAPCDITGQVSSGRKCSEQQVKRNLPTATVWFQPLSRRREAPEEVDHLFCPPAAELCLSKRRTKSTNELAANGRARYFGRLRRRQRSFVRADGGDENEEELIWTLASTGGCLSGRWDVCVRFVCLRCLLWRRGKASDANCVCSSEVHAAKLSGNRVVAHFPPAAVT